MKNLIRLVVISLIVALPINTLVAQNVKNWYAPQNIMVLDKASYKEVFKAFKNKNCIDLVFHFERCKWSPLRDNYMYRRCLEDSAYVNELLLDFEDTVVKESGIKKRVENTPSYYQSDFTLHILVIKVSKDAG